MVSQEDNRTDSYASGGPANGPHIPFPLEGGDLREAAALHVRELQGEFLSRFGERFIARYYLAFVEGPDATALGVRGSREEGGRLVGVMIGASDARAHYSYLVRHHGLPLAMEAVLAAVRSPSLAADLVRTRLLRYTGGLFRTLLRGKTESPGGTGEVESSVGFAVYVAVRRGGRRSGAGRRLFLAFEEFCRGAGVKRIETATRPEGPGERFFTGLGWERGEERATRSGERYLVFHRSIG